MSILNKTAVDTLFLKARTHHHWLDKPVDPVMLEQLYELLKMGPTCMNALPARFVFLVTEAGKEKLKPALKPGNVEQTMSAPVTVIVAYDSRFYDYLPQLFPQSPKAGAGYADDPELAVSTAFRNGSLQGAYLILAARALGLDCGPMSGFDNAEVDRAFFPDGRWRSNFLVNLGYGNPEKLYPRGPRLTFEEACRVL